MTRSALTDARLLLRPDDVRSLADEDPLIATRVFSNLSRILAVQIAKTTGVVVSAERLAQESPLPSAS